MGAADNSQSADRGASELRHRQLPVVAAHAMDEATGAHVARDADGMIRLSLTIDPSLPATAPPHTTTVEIAAPPANDTSAGSDRQWTTGLHQFYRHPKSCIDAVLCYHCHASRQYNMLEHGRPGMHWPMCMASTAADVAAPLMDVNCLCGSFFVTVLNRRRVREKYRIAGSDLNDAVTVLFCHYCANAQHYRELAAHGDTPGTVLFGAAPFVPAVN
mmetsp:Transcript_7233/g.22661  ORF Transcript_7233/g.22661 Transcript_7233/m.22661 type:complete len:216 (-) Transcript_7233:169-816(-)